MAGNIIFLNGASSSGKSSIAKQLQVLLDEPYTIMSVDLFLSQIDSWTCVDESELPQGTFRTRLRAFHHCLGAMSRAGLHQIVDHLFEDPDWLEECAYLLRELPVFLIGVHCSIPELERREQARGDRPTGLAKRQAGKVHLHGVYDLEIDTTSTLPLECAEAIQAFLQQLLIDPAIGLLAEILPEPDQWSP